MSTFSTASNYINKINELYPVAGQDNSTQGFRNNFKNIKSALNNIDSDVYNLKLTSVKTTVDNKFNYNTIKQAALQDCSTVIYDTSETTNYGDIEVDYQNGSYQKFKISGGLHTFTVKNWPGSQRSGIIIISIESESLAGASIDFSAENLVNLGPYSLPLSYSGTSPQLFELWNDGDTGTVYVRGLGGNSVPSVAELIALGTATQSVQTLILGQTNRFTTSTNTVTQYATVITANERSGLLAVVPNQITVNSTNVPVPDIIGDTTATTLAVTTTSGILLGANVNFPNSTSTVAFSVVSFTSSTVTLSPPFEVNAFSVGDPITFTNPIFDNQATVVTFKKNAVTTTTAVANDLKGQIYANSTTLYVSFNNYSYQSTNWVKISGDQVPKTLPEGSTAVTMTVTNTSSYVATNQFVHNILPYGSIIMWYGSVANIPTGWALCNGANGTPNLVDRFVIGASTGTYAVGATGGYTDAAVISHSHTATNTVTDPQHQHVSPAADCGTAAFGANGTITDTFCDSNGNAAVGWLTSAAATGITIDTTLTTTGESATGRNLPPYYALCFIMKVTG